MSIKTEIGNDKLVRQTTLLTQRGDIRWTQARWEASVENYLTFFDPNSIAEYEATYTHKNKVYDLVLAWDYLTGNMVFLVNNVNVLAYDGVSVPALKEAIQKQVEAHLLVATERASQALRELTWIEE